jgi:predicted RNA binding protein YcfA (HicA-like mRNA interferase family)
MPNREVKAMAKIIKDAGWVYDHTEGGHDHYSHPSRPGKVTIPPHGRRSARLAPGTWNSILKQARLR